MNQVGTDWKYSPMRSTKRILYSLSGNRQTDQRNAPGPRHAMQRHSSIVHACEGWQRLAFATQDTSFCHSRLKVLTVVE